MARQTTIPSREDAEAVRRRLAHDPHRPLFHFLPPANWMNDPNGLIQWRGQYHLFYQYNPYNPHFGNKHWGHAVSTDLIHWTDLPIALTPTPGAPDHFDCFSGCAVDDAGVPTLVYTGISNYPVPGETRYPVPLDSQVQCIATSQDGLLTWQKYAGNPVITRPQDLDLVGFRDPFVWKENGRWQALIGAGIHGVGGMMLRYHSADLRHWEYAGPFVSGERSKNGRMWECPNFFRLGNRQVLLFSSGSPRAVRYFTGTYDGETFTPQSEGLLHGESGFYAPQIFEDEGGRRLMFGWLPEGRTVEAQKRAGWTGVMSLPQLLTPGPQGDPWIEPAPEVEMLRETPQQWRADASEEPATRWLAGIRGDCLEIRLRIEPAQTGPWGLLVRRSPDGEEETRIEYEPAGRRLTIGRQNASLDPETDKVDATLVLDGSDDAVSELRIFLDRSVIEVYAGGRCLVGRVYPTRPDSLGFGLTGSPSVREMDVWTMRPVWPARGE